MDEISSAEFRKQYAHLSEPVTVTVLGRPIGQWFPVGYQVQSYSGRLMEQHRTDVVAFGAPRPAPKPGKR